MKQHATPANIAKLIANLGPAPIAQAIRTSARDFRRYGDSNAQIRETLAEMFGTEFQFIRDEINRVA